MKKQYSLKGRDCFSKIFDQGRLFRSRNITINVLQECPGSCLKRNPDTEKYPKFGIVVSKRYGKAHDRNKARRRFRAALSPYIDKIAQNVCVIVRFTGSYKNAAFADIQNDVLFLLRKSGLLK